MQPLRTKGLTKARCDKLTTGWTSWSGPIDRGGGSTKCTGAIVNAPLVPQQLINTKKYKKNTDCIAFNCCWAACQALLFYSTNACYKRHYWWCLVLILCKMKSFCGTLFEVKTSPALFITSACVKNCFFCLPYWFIPIGGNWPPHGIYVPYPKHSIPYPPERSFNCASMKLKQ